MPTSILANTAGSLATAGVGRLLGGGGGDDKIESFSPTGITAGGLTSGFDSRGNLTISSSGERQQAVQNVANTFGAQADAIERFLPQIGVGTSEARKAAISAINNRRSSAIGNLKDNLARRRVLGSGFAQDALARAELEFAQEEARIAAESTLREQAATMAAMEQTYNLRRSQNQVYLDELNLEANLAATLAKQSTEALAANARVGAELDYYENRGRGQVAGRLAAPIGDAVSKAVTGFFT